MNLSDQNKGNRPFLLSPVGKDYLWGGRRLKDDFNKKIDLDPLAETWECSTHPNGPSIVASGEFKGMLLSDVLKEHPEFVGSHPNVCDGQIPILIKFIDAKKDLSVQVHPSDEYAYIHENGSLGKTEMWYVIDALPDSSLVYGFHHSVSKEEVRKAIETGELEKYMNRVQVKKGDMFFIPTGTVHAIGKGCLIAEIQESSDLTYRLYDYNRVDKDGKLRPLHIDKALEVANLNCIESPKQPMNVYRYKHGRATEFLARCKYFQVERMIINTEDIKDYAEFKTGSSTFQVLLCYSGCGTILDEDYKTSSNFFKGDCIFVPANSSLLKIQGKAEFLRIRC